MIEKSTAQECEQLRKEVKESKKEFLNTLKDVGITALLILFLNYTSPDVWTIKDLGLYGIMVALVIKKIK